MTETPSLETDVIAIDRLVEVASRTWPGINQPGGVARVTQIHGDPLRPSHVDVAYIVARTKEKRVPIEYVTIASQYEKPKRDRSLRDRGLILGRCHRCGSLRKDCGSCDWVMEEQPSVSSEAPTRTRKRTNKSSQNNIQAALEEGDVSSDDDSVVEASLPMHHPVDSHTTTTDAYLSLADFIQPEGREAAEQLPSDLVDHTKSIPYPELPTFFNQMADKLEDDLIPTFQLSIAKLQRDVRLWTDHGETTQPDAGEDPLQQCSRLFSLVTQQLVREGTDQCRAALRRMSDRSLFVRHRTSLSKQQRRQIRGSVAMDARDLRLDAIEEKVNQLISTLRDLTVSCEEHIHPESDDDNGNDDDDDDDDDKEPASIERDSEDDYETQDLFPMNQFLDDFEQVDPSERPLGPLDPHPYASKKRKDSPFETFRRPPRKTRRKARGMFSSTMKSQHYQPDEPSGEQDATEDFSPRDTTFFSEAEEPATIHSPQKSAPAGVSDASSLPRATPKPTKKTQRKRQSRTHETTENSEQVSAYTRERRSISQRMQEFLEKNRDTLGERFEPKSMAVSLGTSRTTSRRVNRSNLSSRDAQTSMEADVSNALAYDDREEVLNEPQNDQILMEDLIRRCDRRDNQSVNEQARNSARERAPNQSEAVTLSSELSQCFVSDVQRSREILDILGVFSETGLDSGSAEWLDNLVELLRGEGTATILELIATGSRFLETHVRLLVSIVRNLDQLLDSTLARKPFLDLVVVQLVESVYALLHPIGWALVVPNRHALLRLLEPLRDALASVVPLTEMASYCIVQQLGCQEWRKDRLCTHVFVSSFDPAVWRGFLESNEPPGSVSNSTYDFDVDLLCDKVQLLTRFNAASRFEKLGKIWPRIEVDTTWKVLVFLSVPMDNPKETLTENRWKVLSKLFASSVLVSADDEAEKGLPPPTTLLETFESELIHLVRLLRTGCLEKLPTSDGFVLKLVERAISLQVQDFAGNPESRVIAQARVDVNGSTKAFISRLWKGAHSLALDLGTETRQYPIIDCVFVAQESDTTAFRAPGLLRASVNLLREWFQRLPKKKARQLRFLKQFKTMVEKVSKLEVKEPTIADSGDMDSFAAAFACIGASTQDHFSTVSAFVKESTVAFRILELMFASGENMSESRQVLSVDQMHKIWKFLCPGPIEHFRLSVAQHSRRFEQSSALQPQVVWVMAKTMGVLGTMCCDPLQPTPTPSPGSSASEHGEFYSFPVSCVMACMDYLCTVGGNPQLLECIYVLVTTVFNRLATSIKNHGVTTPVNHLSAQVSLVFIPVVGRCILHELRRNGDGANGMGFRLLLCTLRSMLGFQMLRRKANCSGLSESDDFGGMEDDLFAFVETGGFNGDCAPQVPPATTWSILLEAIHSSKPSELYSLAASSLGGTSQLHLSALGKFWLKEEIDKVCDCLVALVVSEECGEDIHTTDQKVYALLKPPLNSTENALYEAQISRRVYAGLCELSSMHPRTASFVKSNLEFFLAAAIEALLSPAHLEPFPSENVSLLEATGGEEAARHGLTLLQGFNSHPSFHSDDRNLQALSRKLRRRKKKAERVWCTFQSLGGLLPQDDPLSVIFASVSTLSSTSGASSLEKEAFLSYQLIQKIFSDLSKSNPRMFEVLVATSVATLCSQVLKTAQSLKYQEQAGWDDERTGKGFKWAETSVLYSVYVELFIATTALAVQETPLEASEHWKQFCWHFHDCLLRPVLERQHIDLSTNLKVLVGDCNKIAGWKIGASADLAHLPSCPSKLFEGFFPPVARHCRQLLLSRNPSSKLLATITNAVIHSDKEQEKEITSQFGSVFFYDHLEQRSGPLEDDMDNFWKSAYTNSKGDFTQKLAERAVELLSTSILPRFNNKNTPLDSKPKMLLLVEQILVNRTVLIASDHEAMMLELLRVLWNTAIQSLESSQVDEVCVAAVLRCARHLSQMSASDLDTNDVKNQWLRACWTKARTIQPSLAMQELVLSDLRALYALAFYRWIDCVAKLIVASKKDDINNRTNSCFLDNERQSLSKSDDPLVNSIDERSFLAPLLQGSEQGSPSQLKRWNRMLHDLDKEVFAVAPEARKSVVNKYLKTTPVSVDSNSGNSSNNKENLEPWYPSRTVQRAAKELMTVWLLSLPLEG
eukprot:Nitzschia sp. Nitz4//scaffold70_size99833//84841//91685//NITZ4_004610-RA/size99833-snap-gene-0.137-mRNA-1//1//CDS//3329557182//6640//frame0